MTSTTITTITIMTDSEAVHRSKGNHSGQNSGKVRQHYFRLGVFHQT
ncbi:MAG: hypothetical protein LBE06_04495 [Azoarcus sp.]|nr:hypothetical protein [Azoarcus sp.]